MYLKSVNRKHCCLPIATKVFLVEHLMLFPLLTMICISKVYTGSIVAFPLQQKHFWLNTQCCFHCWQWYVPQKCTQEALLPSHCNKSIFGGTLNVVSIVGIDMYLKSVHRKHCCLPIAKKAFLVEHLMLFPLLTLICIWKVYTESIVAFPLQQKHFWWNT